jgi:hypothetical protein
MWCFLYNRDCMLRFYLEEHQLQRVKKCPMFKICTHSHTHDRPAYQLQCLLCGKIWIDLSKVSSVLEVGLYDIQSWGLALKFVTKRGRDFNVFFIE